MRKIILSFFTFLISTSLVLGIYATVTFAATEPQGSQLPISQFDQILGKSGLSSFAGRFHKLSSVEPGADFITSVIFFALDFFKYLIGGIAVIYIIIAGIKLITGINKIDEIAEKQKENLKYIIYGLILIIIADELVTKVFFGQYGECIASASNAASCAKVGGTLIQGIYSFVLSILATISIFVVVLSAFRLITAYGEEETINKQKKRILMSIVGLLVAGVSEFIVKGIVFREAGGAPIDVAAAQKLVFNFTNFVAAFIGAGAFVMLFYGGYLYVISAGNEEQTGKAKKIIISSLIGILIAFAAFGIITTITSFTSGRTVNLPGELPGLPRR